MKRIALVGASGSIGKQTLDVILQHPDQFELVAAAANTSEDFLASLKEKHPSLKAVSLSTFQKPDRFEGLALYEGADGLKSMLQEQEYDLLVNAAVGFAGLMPTLTALDKGIDVALANKESLVAGGELVLEALKKSNTKLYPIDSEHSAIFQCLQGNEKRDVKRLIITASGGSFRNLQRNELENVSVKQALSHPNWSMGPRITIDSATMVNKGFEVIEAHYLFDMDYDQIDVVLHPQSIIHSMVEYNDHAVIAQLGSADMHLPIQYALTYPARPKLEEEHPLDMSQTLDLNFKKMDFDRYPMLLTAYEVGRKKGNTGAIFNGADEQAVALFLQEKISFLQIEESILHALKTVPYIEHPDYAQLHQSDLAARSAVRKLWGLEDSE
jgi:1-deoxy-D-xylulose-5-phosphate reductoisomerase